MTGGDFNFLLLITYGIVMIGAWIISFVIYVCKGVCFSKLCEENRIKNKWLAWIPVGNDYIMLKLGEKPTKFVWIFATVFLCDMLANVDYVGDLRLFEAIYFIVSILQSIITIQALKRINEKYQKAKGLLVVSIIYFIMVLISVCGLIW